MDGFERMMGWMDRHVKLVVAIYLLSSVAVAVAVGTVIFHFVKKLW